MGVSCQYDQNRSVVYIVEITRVVFHRGFLRSGVVFHYLFCNNLEYIYKGKGKNFSNGVWRGRKLAIAWKRIFRPSHPRLHPSKVCETHMQMVTV